MSPSREAHVAAARAQAAEAVQREIQGDADAALRLYVAAVDSLLALVRTAPCGDGGDLRALAARLLRRAEQLKAARTREDPRGACCREGGACGALPWPLWTLPSDDASLAPASDPALHCTAAPAPMLSRRQVQRGVTMAPTQRDDPCAVFDARTPFRGGDFAQGSVTDCSFVVSLEVAAEHDAIWGTSLAHGALAPRKDRVPCTSATGQYTATLRVDGAPRCIALDGCVPRTPSGRHAAVHLTVSDAAWPALLEKAFLIAHGSGYEFGGSNAASDLYMLTGWIPECIDLQSRATQREATWARVYGAWRRGHCLLSAGTGADTDADTAAGPIRGIIPSHCYGILHLDEVDTERTVCLVNPWKAHTARAIARAEGGYGAGDASDLLTETTFLFSDADLSEAPTHVRCSWEQLCVQFEALYVNWDPAFFSHRTRVSGAWHARTRDARGAAALVAESDQYALEVQCGDPRGDARGDVWVLLERHGPRPSAHVPEYIALHAFPGQHRRALVDVHSGGLMDPVSLTPLRAGLAHRAEVRRGAVTAHCQIQGAWLGRASAGSMRYPGFRHNPQYTVTLQAPAALAVQHVQIMLTTHAPVSVQATLVRSSERVASVTERTLVATSGAYTQQLALCDVPAIHPGTYTLVVSTYEPAQAAEFSLCVDSSCRAEVRPLRAEGAGLRHRALAGSGPWTAVLARTSRLLVCVAVPGAGGGAPACALRDATSGALRATSRARADAAQVQELAVDALPPGRYVLDIGQGWSLIDAYSSQHVAWEAASGMTGLDARTERLLEIACIVTDGVLRPLDTGVRYVIQTEKHVLDAMDAWCTRTHGDSGLTHECQDAHVARPHTLVRTAVLAYVLDRVPEVRTACLAGNSVHADKAFLMNEMPELVEHLHYRIVDVSSIKELVWRWYGAEQVWRNARGSQHRALDDVQDSIAELAYYRANIFQRAEQWDVA
ncbi:cysteine protease [Malassezia sp. CBS 17886]|nr:cysteine protease [Malassezia sp. CBS 17886]